MFIRSGCHSFFILFFFLAISSCNVIKESGAVKENLIIKRFYTHYFNDSLKIYIRFFGGHTLEEFPLLAYKKQTPETIKAILKNDLRKAKRKFNISKLLIYSYSKGKFFGYYYIGIIRNNFQNNEYVKTESDNKSLFYVSQLKQFDSFLLKKYIIPLNDKVIVLYCFKKLSGTKSGDSLMVSLSSHQELMTLKTLDRYMPYKKQTKDFSDLVLETMNRDGYLRPLNELQQLKTQHGFYNSDSNLLNQSIYTAFSSLDEIDSVKQLMFEEHTSKGNDIKNRGKGKEINMNDQGAMPRILQAAEENKVLMFNESHYDWRHRYFLTLLLDSLFKRGYKYLCMEDLEKADSINKRKFPITTDGSYIKEPFMGNMVRSALKIGYKLVAYEDTTGDVDLDAYNSRIDKREYLQANNLYRQYKKDKTAKWLVFAGYAHINQLYFSKAEPNSMAKYFYELSGIHPFVINQTQFCDIFDNSISIDSSKEGYYYLKNGQIKDSDIIKQSNLYIINNLTLLPYEKENNVIERIPYNLKYEIDKQKDMDLKIIEIFFKDEYFKNAYSIPLYIKRINNTSTLNKVWLPDNKYYLVIKNANEEIIYEGDLKK